MLKNNIKYLISVLIAIILLSVTLSAADAPEKREILNRNKLFKTQNGPLVADDWAWHKIGMLWQRVTNFSYFGDDAYENRSPSCDWPGGSGNSYLYRGSLWMTAKINGQVHSSQSESHEFAAIDSIHVFTGDNAVSEEDTYTKYYDVKAPLSSGHTPLGIELTEKTYAWSAGFADDFIIYEITVKNVGVDTDEDGYPDTDRDLEEFYFTYRLDGDVSKLSSWPTEYRFSNQDDHVMANGFDDPSATWYESSPWDWVKLFPFMDSQIKSDSTIFEELKSVPIDSTMMFMWDGDKPGFPADNGQADDFANPAADGTLQTPGFLGLKVLKTEPASFGPSSFHTCHIYNDPGTDQETWDRMIDDPVYEDIILVNGLPYPLDYRGILTYGPIDTLKAGDSVTVTFALGVGCDPDSGGIYSLLEFVNIMNVAQYIVDNDFSMDISSLMPGAPTTEIIESYDANGAFQGVNINWDNAAESHQSFKGYRVWKSAGKNASTGDYNWEVMETFYPDSSGSWPPPSISKSSVSSYSILDKDVDFGFFYYYSVQAICEITDPPIGLTETNKLDANSYVPITPTAPADNTTLDNVKVAPNPYIGSADWNNPMPSDGNPWEHRIVFFNLPSDASITIFTLDGDYVDKIYAGEGAWVGEGLPESSEGAAEWDLITCNDQEAAPGIYMYVVKSPSLGSKVGKFVIIR